MNKEEQKFTRLKNVIRLSKRLKKYRLRMVAAIAAGVGNQLSMVAASVLGAWTVGLAIDGKLMQKLNYVIAATIAVNRMCEAGYPCGLLIAPVMLVDGWKAMYTELLEQLRDDLTEKAQKQMFLEIIMMTYSYVHRAINSEAFPNALDLYDKQLMTGRGRGRYCYRPEARAEAEEFLRSEIKRILGNVKILYIS